MKKKVLALLLVLAMVLSMIPMNVFAAPRGHFVTSPLPRGANGYVAEGLYNIDFNANLADFAGLLAGTGDDVTPPPVGQAFMGTVPAAGITLPQGTVIYPGTTLTFATTAERTAFITAAGLTAGQYTISSPLVINIQIVVATGGLQLPGSVVVSVVAIYFPAGVVVPPTLPDDGITASPAALAFAGLAPLSGAGSSAPPLRIDFEIHGGGDQNGFIGDALNSAAMVRFAPRVGSFPELEPITDGWTTSVSMGLPNENVFATSLTGVGANGDFDFRTVRQSRTLTSTFVSFSDGDTAVIPPAAQGFLGIRVPVQLQGGNRNNVRLTARLFQLNEVTNLWSEVAVLVDRNLVQGVTQGVNISRAGDPVSFSAAAPVGTIRIQERAAGVLAGNEGHVLDLPVGAPLNAPRSRAGELAIRLTAPRGYTWHTTGIRALANSGSAHYEGLTIGTTLGGIIENPLYASTGNPMAAEVEGLYVLQTVSQRHELIILLDNDRAAPGNPLRNVPDTLEISGLWLIPAPGAPATGDVNIDVALGYRGANITNAAGEVTGFHPFNANPGTGLINRNNDDWRLNNITVANRAVSTVDIVDPGEIRTFASGRRNTDWTQGGYHTVRLQENAPGALFGSINTISFTLTQPGVQFYNVQYRIPGTQGDWRNIEGSASHLVGRTHFSSDRADITPMPLPAGQTRRLEVRFNLSIEAGFVGKYNTDEISVLVSGAGFGGTVTIAEVFDPVDVVPVSRTDVDTGNIFNVINPTELANVVIYEAEPGLLEVGHQIWVYMVGTQRGRPVPFHWAEVMFDTNRNPTVNAESNLALAPADIRTVDVGGRMVDMFVFEVISPSIGTPGVITLTDNFVMGNVAPGVEYMLVVTGPQIAANSNIVFAAGDNDYTPFTALDNVNGLFDTLPYSAEIVRFGTFETEIQPPGGWQPPPTHQPQLPPLPPRQSVWLNREIPFLAGTELVQAPVIFRTVAGTGVGFVSLRAFAYLTNSEILMDTPVQGQVTIQGLHSDGVRPVSVTVATNHSLINVITGETLLQWDIATLAGAATGVPAGGLTVINYQGRLYLPFRAVANAFGYDVRAEGPFIVFE